MTETWFATTASGVAMLLLGSRLLVGGLHRPVGDPALRRRGLPRASFAGGATVRIGGPAIMTLAALVGAWLLGPVEAGVIVTGGLLLRTRLRVLVERRSVERVARAMPELIDLFRVAAAAGHPPVHCVELVTARAPEVCRPALTGAVRRSAAGASLAASLEPVGPELGPLGPQLVEVVLGAHRTGVPLDTGLAHLAATARDLRRREAEARARRLPVTMLFPLVCCVLPAFGLLAVVPLLAASLGSLQP